MLSKEQYIEILNTFEKYAKTYEKVLNKPMSEEFAAGLMRGLDLIKGLVEGSIMK